MGYRDDFYVTENIIGYTGTLTEHPTVYFLLMDGLTEVGGRTHVKCYFGHITQKHDNEENVGREPVRQSYSYSIHNVTKNGEERAEECVYGRQELRSNHLGGKTTSDGHERFHTSRNRFEKVTAGNKELLAAAIDANQVMKKNWADRYESRGYTDPD